MSELLTRFGVHPESRVSLLGIRDAAFLRDILPQVANPAQHRAAKDSDFIFLGVESEGQLKRLEPLKKYLTPSGAIWVIYPNNDPRLTNATVLTAIHRAGLTSNQILNFSPTHTALCAS